MKRIRWYLYFAFWFGLAYYVDNMKRKKVSGGALPYQTIFKLVENGSIKNTELENIKPASLDLSLSDEIYKVEGIFPPKENETVRDVLEKIRKKKYSLGEALEKDQMYIVRLNETLHLPRDIYAFCNPKSTTGRLDTHVRLIADGMSRYDSVRAGFSGELWVSIVPRTFSIKLYRGLSVNQIRFFNADTRLTNTKLAVAMREHKFLWRKNGKPYNYDEIKVRDNDGSLILTLDLEHKNVGFESVFSKKPIDLAKIKFYDSRHFFKPVKPAKNGYLYLKKGSFYILSTNEAVRIPPDFACEMLPMDERSGDFRSHYAGFIDPGWGWGKNAEGKGRTLTLEVRPFEDLIVRHGQPIAKVSLERTTETSEKIYDYMSSNYVKQSGPKLAKQFK